MKTLNLLMAVSHDGFVARGPDDEMHWTGLADKTLFKMLTLVNPSLPLLAGRRTAAMLPQLPGRTVVPLSRDPAQGLSLERAAELYPGTWLIGGPEVAREALRLGLIQHVYESRVQARLKEGIPWRPIEKYLGKMKGEVHLSQGVVLRVHGVAALGPRV